MAPGPSICHNLYSRFIRKSIQLPLVAREFVPCLPRDLLDKNVGYLWSYQDIKLNLLNMVECLTYICTVTNQHNMFGWWFGTCFIFPYIGNSNPNSRTPSFFRGVGLNHQPEYVYPFNTFWFIPVLVVYNRSCCGVG